MSKQDDGGPAFPMYFGPNDGGNNGGMALRDYFAGQAMAGLFANSDAFEHNDDATMAKYAYSVADAMIEARKRRAE